MAYGRGGYRGGYGAGRGGLGSFLTKAVRTVARVAAPVLRNVPVVGGIIGAGEAVLRAQPGRSVATTQPGGAVTHAAARAPEVRDTGRGKVLVGESPLGTIGVRALGGRRMNPGNAKAARRAIRRIKSVRGMLQSIERQLPRRKCSCAGKARRGR